MNNMSDFWKEILAVARQYTHVLTKARPYAPAVVASGTVAVVVGCVGYNAEFALSDKTTPGRAITVMEERDARLLRELEGQADDDKSKRYSKTLPDTVLDRNELRKGIGDSTVKMD